MSIAQPPFLSEINLPEQVSINQPFILTLTGNWPNPGWHYYTTEITPNPDQKLITISYLGKSSGGIALQVLKSVTAEVELVIREIGEWTIEVRGRDQSLKHTIIVI